MSQWDVVLRGGRVIDPESGLDAVRDVAVADRRVAAVGTALAPGRAEVDVAGQVVTAGFIDLHSHVNDIAGLRMQALDGVTTALELEAGVTPVAAAYRRAEAAGSRVSTEAYPYGSGMTGIGAAFLAPERLGERGLVPTSLTYAPTGERSPARSGCANCAWPIRAGWSSSTC